MSMVRVENCCPDGIVEDSIVVWLLVPVPMPLAQDGIGTIARLTVAERFALIGIVPEVVALDPGDQVTWFSNAGNVKIEFDAQRCPFSSNVFQAPAGARLSSGPVRAGTKPGVYKYRLSVNDALVGHPEVLVREK
ncbi:MAG TPA: hypothetical protein VGS27_02790 [Candidatus Sulfotelmatobacter sp.]|nr:hypothetical protein [Candidatus Sulfotelmatobacter sp.]